MKAQHRQGSTRTKVAAVVGVGALVAAMAGTGALSTLYTSIAGNEFRAAVPADYDPTDPTDPDRPDGALLVISGDPIEKTFDTAVYNDQVQAAWTLTNQGPAATAFDGTFEVTGTVSDELAAAVTVAYGVTNASGDVTEWRSAGTLAAPAALADVLGVSQIDGDAELVIPVRLLLADPAELLGAGQTGDDLLVTADFVVSYLDPLQQP